MHRFTVLRLLPLPLTALAADALAQAPVAGSDPTELAGSLFQMLGGLAVVIALLLASLWLVRRLAAPRGSAAAAIEVLGAAAVGPRERVVLVRLGEQLLVLGVAPGSVTRLHEMKAEELPLAARQNAHPSSSGSARNFSAWLGQAMKRQTAERQAAERSDAR
ncbi:flagellar biosynthetic protein FliO [Thauera sp. SDU_THAU2]|uniref:flagellar biosynthetic protein FliO n=1 Tax=Thauera sp. SDU_THAU2 TaxID=3136633 RepID=UPI00311F2B60